MLAPVIETHLAKNQPEHRSLEAAMHACAARGHALAGSADLAIRSLDLVLPAIERAPVWAMDYILTTCVAATALWIVGRDHHVEPLERSLRTKILPADFRYPMVDARLALAWLCALTERFDEASGWFAEARAVLEEQGRARCAPRSTTTRR